MNEDFLISAIDVPFTFTERPMSLPGDLRPLWRIALLLLVLHSRRSCKSKLQVLHVLCSAARDSASRSAFLDIVQGRRTPDSVIIHYEPWLNRAIDFAQGEGLVEIHSGGVSLTAHGLAAAKSLQANSDLMSSEKDFLCEVKRIASETRVVDMLKGEKKLESQNT